MVLTKYYNSTNLDFGFSDFKNWGWGGKYILFIKSTVIFVAIVNQNNYMMKTNQNQRPIPT